MQLATHLWHRNPLVILLASLTASIGGVFVISILLLNIPITSVQQMVFVLAGTGIFTTVTAYSLYRLRILQWFTSLRWTLLLMSFFTTGMVLVNIWILSELMFVDSHYVSMTTMLLVFAGLTAISFAYFASKAMTERLVDLSQAADKLADGDLTTRLNVEGNDEISHLTQAFNTMAKNLQEVDDQKRALEKTRRDLVAWVSHDLRTPLTSMRVMIEAMADGVITDEETQRRYMQTSLAEIEHLSHLIDDLFEMARLDVGHLELNFQYTSLPDLISDTIGSMSAKAQKKEITLSGTVADDVDLIYVAPEKVQRVLYNLVSNAIDYTPPNERVSICAAKQSTMVQIDIFNSGVYIDADVLPRLFESFYRGETSRAQGADGHRGTGLGLAIARGLIEAHHGKIWATSTPDYGTTFSFTVPLMKLH